MSATTTAYPCSTAGHQHPTVTDARICSEFYPEPKITRRTTTRSLDRVSTVVAEQGRYQVRVIFRTEQPWLIWDTATESTMTRTADYGMAVAMFDQLVALSAKHGAL